MNSKKISPTVLREEGKVFGEFGGGLKNESENTQKKPFIPKILGTWPFGPPNSMSMGLILIRFENQNKEKIRYNKC